MEAWIEFARPAALDAAADPGLRDVWLRHGKTWFVGVDALPNTETGQVGEGPEFGGAGYRAAMGATGVSALHRAQVSVTYPGYPLRDRLETDAAFRFRARRDAAHLDGLLPEGPGKRRHLRELHAWILGVALTPADAGAAPLVVWEGSHRLIRSAFEARFDGVPPENWGDEDVTDAYAAVRREVFAHCARVELPLAVGETVLLHRHLIHGVAPWDDAAVAAPEGRAIAYFRPCFVDAAAWLSAP